MPARLAGPRQVSTPQESSDPAGGSGGIANESRDRGMRLMDRRATGAGPFRRAMPPLAIRGRTRCAIAVPLADVQLLSRHAKVDLNAPVHDANRVGVDREDRGQRTHLAGQQVESSPVSGALHQAVLELTFAKHAAVVGADVVDRAPGAVLAVPDTEASALGLHDRDLARRDVADVGDADEAAQAAAPSTSAMRPMRGASASVTRVRTCTSGMSFTTRWKNPRTSICSAVERSSPRDMM